MSAALLLGNGGPLEKDCVLTNFWRKINLDVLQTAHKFLKIITDESCQKKKIISYKGRLTSDGSRIFPRWGRQVGVILQLFAENCMKMKEFGPPGGHASLPPPTRQC